MKFKLPENISELSREELLELRSEALAEAKSIDEQGESLSREDIESLDALMSAIGEIDGASAVLDAVDNDAAAARERLAALNAPADEVEDAFEAEEVVEVEEAAVELEPVLASGRRRPTAARAAVKAPKVVVEETKSLQNGGLVIVAAADVPDHTANQRLEGMEDVAKAFLARTVGFGGDNSWQGNAGENVRPFQMGKGAQQFGVARLRKPEVEGMTLDPRSQTAEQQFEIIMNAAKESSLPGGSLVAAGGWCAPSEQIWGFCELETTEGLLSIPEITAKRGGISFTRGPSFGELFADANFGFIQTETQAIAGTTKPCYAIECEPWEEVRLDAVGFCITAPILTNAAYPELVRRVLNLAGVGHARRINASTIQRISALIGAAINHVEVGAVGSTSGVSDTLDAVALQGLRIRQTNAMSPQATIEGIAPHWMREYFRSDLGRRTGVDMLGVTNQQIDAWFAVRGISLQYVYDYQMLDTTSTGAWTAFPAAVEIMLFPAGAYVRLTNDVINLNAVYDHDLLTQNTYTAAFFEEGMAVANTCGGGVKVSITLNNKGATGFPAIGAGVGVTISA